MKKATKLNKFVFLIINSFPPPSFLYSLPTYYLLSLFLLQSFLPSLVLALSTFIMFLKIFYRGVSK